MITKDCIETAHSFLHQKRNFYTHSSFDWQKAAHAWAKSKLNAKKSKWRIPKSTLLSLAAIGGSIGAWLGMKGLTRPSRRSLSMAFHLF